MPDSDIDNFKEFEINKQSVSIIVIIVIITELLALCMA